MGQQPTPWSIKGIDPKAREAARERAKRAGMTLGEWVNQAILAGDGAPDADPATADGAEADNWGLGAPAEPALQAAAIERLTQRLDHAEQRQNLTVKGIDRAVGQLDRAVGGLAQRLDQTEQGLRSTTAQVLQAIEEAKHASAGGALEAVAEVKAQLSAAEQAAQRAAQHALSEAQAARTELSRRLELVERSAAPLADLEAAQRLLAQRLDRVEHAPSLEDLAALRQAHEALGRHVEATHAGAAAAQAAATSAIEEVRGLEQTLAARLADAEAAARDATAGLRQAAGAAIADLRTAQLGLNTRLREVEDAQKAGPGPEVEALQAAHAQLAERIAALALDERLNLVSALQGQLGEIAERQTRAEDRSAQETSGLRREVAGLAETVAAQDAAAGDRLNAGLRQIAERVDALGAQVPAGVSDSLAALDARLTAAEAGAAETVRVLEAKVATLDTAVADTAGLRGEAAELRDLLDQRLEALAQSMAAMVDGAKAQIAGQVNAALDGLRGEELETALADVNRRLAAAERRQAQTIEAISLEIKRLSETLDRRLRGVEERNDGAAAAAAVREDLERLGGTMEARFADIAQREAAAFDRMGQEMGRMAERMDMRIAAADNRSAQALETIGDQVGRMAERFAKRQDQMAEELGERLVQSEERQALRLNETLSALTHRLSETEERAAGAVSPVQKAMTRLAARLQAIEDGFARTPGVIAPPSPFPSAFAAPETTGQPETDEAPAPPADAEPETTAPAPAPYAGAYAPAAPPPQGEPVMQALTEATGGATEGYAAFSPFDEDPFEAPKAAPDGPGRPAPDPAALWSEDLLGDDEDADAQAADQAVMPAEPKPPGHPEGRAPAATAPAPGESYLSAARRAAQAQSGAGIRPGAAKPNAAKPKADGPTPGLRGASRLMVWGAAGAIAVAIAGGSYLLSQGGADAPAAEPEPSPAVINLDEAAAGADQTDEADDAADAGPGGDTLAPVGALDVPPGPDGLRAGEGAPLPPPAASGPPAAPVPPPPQAAAAPPPAPPRAQPAPPAQARATGPQPTPAATVSPQAPRAALEQAAARGDTVAQYDLAVQLMNGGQKDQGIALLRRAAAQGLAMAQYRLAKAYERGDGVETSIVQARQWTERAAASGNRAAMHDLGVFFARGEGAPFDQAAAFRWFRQAAELGVADSQYNLGVLYERGNGVAQNLPEALFWFHVAARQGDGDARARAAALEGRLNAGQTQQARARAEAFRPRAASPRANGDFGPRPWAGAPT